MIVLSAGVLLVLLAALATGSGWLLAAGIILALIVWRLDA